MPMLKSGIKNLLFTTLPAAARISGISVKLNTWPGDNKRDTFPSAQKTPRAKYITGIPIFSFLEMIFRTPVAVGHAGG